MAGRQLGSKLTVACGRAASTSPRTRLVARGEDRRDGSGVDVERALHRCKGRDGGSVDVPAD